MSALTDLRRGEFGEDFAGLLYLSMRAVARARNFPPPADHTVWSPDAVLEASHDFLISTHARRRLTELAVLAADDEELVRLLQTACLNFLRERSRATTIGRLIRRLKDLLRSDPRFAEVAAGQVGAGNVILAGTTATAPFGGRREDLARAAWSVKDVTIVRWTPNARRESPIADRDSLLRVSLAVLAFAEGSLPWDQLAAAVGERFGLSTRSVPGVVATDDLDSIGTEADAATAAYPASAIAPTEPLFRTAAAESLLTQLTNTEILVLAHLDEPVRTIATFINASPSTAAVLKNKVADKLRILLTDDDDAEETALEAIRLARERLT
jgi:hypothetical protein